MRRVNPKAGHLASIPAGGLIEIFQPSANFKNAKAQFAPVSLVAPTAGYSEVVLPGDPEAHSGAGAISVAVYKTNLTTTGVNALTLADGTVAGQLKRIQMVVDGGDGTLTPANFGSNTTVTFADAGDTVDLIWDGTNWLVLDAFNTVDGISAPVIA
jgi:hypothetical protein